MALTSDDYLNIGELGLDAPSRKGKYTSRELQDEWDFNKDNMSALEMLEHWNSMRQEGTRFNKKADAFMDGLRNDYFEDNVGGEPSVGDTDAINPTYKFDPAIAGAIERSANYRDRAISGRTAQDLYGTKGLNASGNNDGIVVGDPAAGGDQNKAQQAADSEIHRHYDPEQFKQSVASRARQAVMSKFA